MRMTLRMIFFTSRDRDKAESRQFSPLLFKKMRTATETQRAQRVIQEFAFLRVFSVPSVPLWQLFFSS